MRVHSYLGMLVLVVSVIACVRLNVPCEKEPPLDKLCQMTSVNVFHCMSESR